MGRVTRVGLFAVVVAGGYVLWQKRFDIQRSLEALGIKTPLFKGSVVEIARSVAAKAGGKFDHGATIAERTVDNLDDEYPKAKAL